jgi:hypothetical protein
LGVCTVAVGTDAYVTVKILKMKSIERIIPVY